MLPAFDADPAIVLVPRQLASVLDSVPTIFLARGQSAAWKFVEFFTANIRNPHTRRAYAIAVSRFCRWCEGRKLQLEHLTPFVVAGYVEQLGTQLSKPSVKQHLAAIRMLFDYLVLGQVVPVNPASSVRGPRHSVKKGKTPVLTAEETRQLLDSIDVTTIAGLRDRALIGVMVFSFARVGAVLSMNVEDYYPQGKRWWLALHEKGGKHHQVPVHHKAQEFFDAYLQAAGIEGQRGTPLFRRLDRKRNLVEGRLHPREALAMIKRRARQAGLPDNIGCHTFRATGITAYLQNGGTVERAAQIANHESTRTTQLYNRTADTITLDEIERILI
jgi:site-specific recombinase XerD